MTDKDDRPQLQRRGGRRVSIPSSPISPSLTKRNDRSFRSPEIFQFPDNSTATGTSSEQPSIDLTIPSPAFDDLGLTSGTSEDASPKIQGVHTVVTEDPRKVLQVDSADHGREAYSKPRTTDYRNASAIRPTYVSDLSSRSSPVLGRTSEGRERALEIPVSMARNYSTTSLITDRSANDENALHKVPTTKKSRLNLLNPMSLLARRRSSQNARLEEVNPNVSPLQVPAIPDNFDPSIRGNFVHDFSTPRSKRSQFDNSPRRETFSSPISLRRPSDFGTPGALSGSSPTPALHSPMFKEHFQDDENALRPGQTAYLHNVTTTRKLFDAPVPASLPSFAQKLPVILPDPDGSEEHPPFSIEVPHPSAPPPIPPRSPKRTPSPHLDLPPLATLPKHMTSVSSRFSFQIADQASSVQEKLLEERHKEHFAKGVSNSKDLQEPDEDVDDNYEFDADDDFEERIPGVNAGFDDDDGFDTNDIPIRNINIQSSQQQASALNPALHGFHFTPATDFSPTGTYHTSEPTPRDVEGFAIGVANTKDSPIKLQSNILQDKSAGEANLSMFLEGLRISTVDRDQQVHRDVTPPSELLQTDFDDTDLYFDDGEFDMDQTDSNDHFDESLLDDDAAEIRDIPAENAKRYEEACKRSAPGDQITAIDPRTGEISRDTSSSSNFVNVKFENGSDLPNFHSQTMNHGLSNRTSVLTENNLAAYHDALAEAANLAAANGKFNRQVSFKSDQSEDNKHLQTPDGVMRYGIGPGNGSIDMSSEDMGDYDTFGFDDDDMDDDLMIAEANAEALENDDDGFYGQEFGFFARAHGKDTSDSVNGGFFAARGSNGIKRSHSGKANFQEPSLTPITERSEWSTRNSVASLQFHGGLPGGAQAGPSPGLNQLLDSPLLEDEMSLSALIKLRRGAFGGSSTSINSLGERSMPGSSPLAHMSKNSFPPVDPIYMTKQSTGTSNSILESEEEDGEGELPTLTQNTPRKKVPGSLISQTHGPSTHLSSTEMGGTTRKSHHRRNSSGADSVSYVRDQDGHWVLERRRTGDDGEQELIEREYLAGARI